MRRTWMFAIATGAAGLMFTTGCDRGPDTSRPDTPPPAAADRAGSAVKRDLQNAWDAARKYSYEQRTEMADAAQKRLDKVQQSLADFRTRVESAPADARDEWRGIADNLQSKLDAARNELRKARDAQASDWDAVSSHVHDAMKQLDDAYRTAEAKLGPR